MELITKRESETIFKWNWKMLSFNIDIEYFFAGLGGHIEKRVGVENDYSLICIVINLIFLELSLLIKTDHDKED